MVGNNSGGGLINVVDQVCFPFIRLDVTLCRDSIHCPFESGLSPLTLEAVIPTDRTTTTTTPPMPLWCTPFHSVAYEPSAIPDDTMILVWQQKDY